MHLTQKTTSAARALGISPAQLLGLIRQGHVAPPARDESGHYLWSEGNLTAARQFLASRPAHPDAEARAATRKAWAEAREKADEQAREEDNAARVEMFALADARMDLENLAAAERVLKSRMADASNVPATELHAALRQELEEIVAAQRDLKVRVETLVAQAHARHKAWEARRALQSPVYVRSDADTLAVARRILTARAARKLGEVTA